MTKGTLRVFGVYLVCYASFVPWVRARCGSARHFDVSRHARAAIRWQMCGAVLDLRV